MRPFVVSRSACCLIVSLLSSVSLAQTPPPNCKPVSYSGQVVLNTASGNGLQGVQILINGFAGPVTGQAKAGPQSGLGGNFRYTLADCPGTLVRVQALKAGYSLVNHVEMTGHVLRGDLGSNQRQFLVILSADKELEQRRMDYYAKLADLNFTKEIERLRGRNQELERQLAQSKQTIPATTKIIEELATNNALLQQALEEREAQKEQAQQIARVFAKLATSDIDSVYLKAFGLYREGKLEEAQQKLPSGDLDQELQESEREVEMGSKLLESGKRKRRFAISKAMLKANLYQAQYDYSQAGGWYEKAVLADSTQLDIVLTYAYFLQNQNRAKEPEKWYKRALALKPDEEQQSRIFNNLGVFYRANSRVREAESAYLQAKKIREHLVKLNPAKYEPYLATTLTNLGVFYKANNRAPEAEEAYLQAKQIYERLAKRNAFQYEPLLAITLTRLGFFYATNNRIQEAEMAYSQSKQSYERLAKLSPDQYKNYLDSTQNNLYYFSDVTNRSKETEKTYLQAKQNSKRFARLDVAQYEAEYAITLNNLGVFYADTNRANVAEAAYLEARQSYERLVKLNSAQYEPALATTITNLAFLYAANNRPREAEAAYLQAKQIYERLAKQNTYLYEPELAKTLTNLGLFYGGNNQPREAGAAHLQAKQIYERLAKLNPDQYESDLADTLHSLGIIYADNNWTNEAKTVLEAAKKIYSKWASKAQQYQERLTQVQKLFDSL